MAGILEKYRDLFEKPTFAHIATIGPTGAPHVTPVWIDYDGRHVLWRGTSRAIRASRSPSSTRRTRTATSRCAGGPRR